MENNKNNLPAVQDKGIKKFFKKFGLRIGMITTAGLALFGITKAAQKDAENIPVEPTTKMEESTTESIMAEQEEATKKEDIYVEKGFTDEIDGVPNIRQELESLTTTYELPDIETTNIEKETTKKIETPTEKVTKKPQKEEIQVTKEFKDNPLSIETTKENKIVIEDVTTVAKTEVETTKEIETTTEAQTTQIAQETTESDNKKEIETTKTEEETTKEIETTTEEVTEKNEIKSNDIVVDVSDENAHLKNDKNGDEVIVLDESVTITIKDLIEEESKEERVEEIKEIQENFNPYGDDDFEI